MENLSNDFLTTLNGGIDDSQTSIVVASDTGSPDVNFRIRIEDEYMLVTGKAGTTWTVTRGIEDSVPVAHSSGVDVAHVLTKGGLKQYLLEHGPLLTSPVVPADMIRTVPAGSKFVAYDELDVEGTLIVEGTVLVR